MEEITCFVSYFVSEKISRLPIGLSSVLDADVKCVTRGGPRSVFIKSNSFDCFSVSKASYSCRLWRAFGVYYLGLGITEALYLSSS